MLGVLPLIELYLLVGGRNLNQAIRKFSFYGKKAFQQASSRI